MKALKKILTTICCIGITLIACSKQNVKTAEPTVPQPEQPKDTTKTNIPSKILMGYYPYWYDNYKADKIPYTKLTHILHSFIRPNPDGTLYVPEGFLESSLLAKAHEAGKKVLISVGGADDIATKNLSIVANSATLRTTFINNLKTFVATHGYDGVDVDWEFPANATDRTNFNLLMQALRPEFNLIAIAVNGTDYFSQWVDFYTIKNYVDYISIMAYDMHGAWSAQAGHNAPLYQGAASAAISVQTMADYIEYVRGVPRNKIVMGLPSYGYQYPYAKKLYDSEVRNAFFMPYKDIAPLIGASWTTNLDTASVVPYLRYNAGTGLISYDDATSITKKVEYALGYRDYAGVMIWELSQDYLAPDNQPLVDAAYKAWQKY